MVVWINWETRRNRFATRQGALSQGTAPKSAKSSMTRECHVLFREGLEVKFLRATRLGGLWFFFIAEKGKPYRALGWACVITFGAIYALNPRVYYLWPAFPILQAGGSVLWESWLSGRRLRWVQFAYPSLMVVMGVALAPMLIPVLPVEIYIRYATAMHLETPAIEKWQLGPLPQIYASEFGWEEMVATVADVYLSLPPAVRARTAIFAQNFGQAGAIDLFGPKYGLPKAISGHQNYFLWGPREYTGESVIVMGDRQEVLERKFDF